MKRILVAVKDDNIFVDLVALATQLAIQNHAEIYFTYVIEVPLSLPLDEKMDDELEKGDYILDRAADTAEEKQLEVKTDIIQARTAGAGIVSQALNIQAELVLIGLKEYTGFGETLGSETVDYVLKKAPCHVLVFRYKAGEE